MRLPVLLYHHVGPPRPGTYSSLTISPEQFERDVRWLAQCGYVGIRPADWLTWCRNGTPLPPKPVLLTFDDAYADVAEHALPLLRRYAFGAAVFVVTRRIGGTNMWDTVRGSAPHRLMSMDQIREWADGGIEFGAHSRTHADLTTMSSDQMEAEIRGSHDDLVAILERPVQSFAYPYGGFNDAVRERVRGAFACAFTCNEGLNRRGGDPYVLRRSMAQPGDSRLALMCRVGWGRYPVGRWRGRLRLRSRATGVVRPFVGSPQ